MIKSSSFMLLGVFILAACATTPQVDKTVVLERYPDIAKLEQALVKGSENGWQLLSPQHYESAQAALASALKQGAAAAAVAGTTARMGLSSLDKAEAQINVTRYELQNVLAARKRAQSAGANRVEPENFVAVDRDLKRLSSLLEDGKKAKVRGERSAIEAQYAELELMALKRDTLTDAAELIKQAKRDNIDDYAPNTIRKAEQELDLAKQVIESDRNAKDKAQQHAQWAIWNVQRATQIAELLKEFKQSAMSDEDIVLWYQQQLATGIYAFVNQPDFSQKNSRLVSGIAAELKQKSLLLHELQVEIDRQKSQYDRSISDKERNLAQMQEKVAEERRQNALMEGKFKQIQQLFTESEAEVYRQGNDVLIRTYGFTFASGSSEIRSDNYPLLNKIVKSIELFPGADIAVSGHTDNRGGDAINESLSKDRAEKVASFLVSVGRMELAKVTSVGFGKRKPLASNDTSEGRESNRRVEILIKNPHLLP